MITQAALQIAYTDLCRNKLWIGTDKYILMESVLNVLSISIYCNNNINSDSLFCIYYTQALSFRGP